MIELTLPNELSRELAITLTLQPKFVPMRNGANRLTLVARTLESMLTRLKRQLNCNANSMSVRCRYRGACGAVSTQAQELRNCLSRMASMMQLAMQQQAELLENLNRNLSCSATSLGDFNILRELGRGGMGVVYEAEQLSLGRRVALKVLPYTHGLNPVRLQRFRNEAQAAASLNHPNIVPIYAVGNRHGVHYYAMQMIEGRSGAQVIADLVNRRRNNDWTILDAATPGSAEANCRKFVQNVTSMFHQLAIALDHAHQRGVIHRDIKPANLMLDCTGKVWITDLGLAQSDTAAPLTQSSDVIGTLRYISPELLDGDSPLADPQTDIYALGATFYEFLTLKPMIAGSTYEDIVQQIQYGDAFNDEAELSFIPRDLLAIIKKTVSKLPSDRYHSAQEMADALERFSVGERG